MPQGTEELQGDGGEGPSYGGLMNGLTASLANIEYWKKPAATNRNQPEGIFRQAVPMADNHQVAAKSCLRNRIPSTQGISLHRPDFRLAEILKI